MNKPDSDRDLLEQKVWDSLLQVMDPEIPFISVVDLGIITSVEVDEENNNALVKMTPTFTGCPAIGYMQNQIKEKVEELNIFDEVSVDIDFSTPWSSNRISEEGKKALKNFGLASPPKIDDDFDLSQLNNTACPHCGSENTNMRSPFGPTLCRALHYCYDCKQAFEQFKPL